MADEFCKVYDRMVAKLSLKAAKLPKKRKYHRASTLSDAEIMVILILFHSSGYRCLKHFYLEYVCIHLRHLFPKVVSYSRYVELEKKVMFPLMVCCQVFPVKPVDGKWDILINRDVILHRVNLILNGNIVIVA